MTEPTQQTQGQQQGQQQGYTDPGSYDSSSQSTYVDDILWWEDVFGTATEIEEDLPYGDILEKKYQINPSLQEDVPYTPDQQITSESPSENMVDVAQVVAQTEGETIQQEVGVESAKVDSLLDTKLQTDVQKKYGELYFTTKRIYQLKNRLGVADDIFDIIWADNDKVFIVYRFFLDVTEGNTLYISKIEQNKDTQEETNNELKFAFNEEESSLEVMVNSVMLFDEMRDFTEDQKKKMQVSEKLNKFIFLAGEEQKKLEKEIEYKEEEEREKRRLQDIFRNF